MVKLHGHIGSPYVRIAMVALEEAKADYEYVHVDIMAGGTKTEEFLKLNPLGKVPALSDGDFSIGESAAIVRYVSDKFGGNFLPQEPKDKATVEMWW